MNIFVFVFVFVFVCDSVTQSPIELFWTAKKKKKRNSPYPVDDVAGDGVDKYLGEINT